MTARSLLVATVKKSFEGDLVGKSTAELLACQSNEKDLTAGAGYVALALSSFAAMGYEIVRCRDQSRGRPGRRSIPQPVPVAEYAGSRWSR